MIVLPSSRPYHRPQIDNHPPRKKMERERPWLRPVVVVLFIYWEGKRENKIFQMAVKGDFCIYRGELLLSRELWMCHSRLTLAAFTRLGRRCTIIIIIYFGGLFLSIRLFWFWSSIFGIRPGEERKWKQKNKTKQNDDDATAAAEKDGRLVALAITGIPRLWPRTQELLRAVQRGAARR